MPNFDAAAGIDETSLNGLLASFYQSAAASSPPAFPFGGSDTRNIDGIGEVTLTWSFGAAPTLAFGPPTLDVWNASLDAKGNTNGQDGNPLPANPAVQLLIPTLTVGYTVGTQPPVGGQTNNLGLYATLAFPAGEVDVTLLGLTIDESDFSAWDKAIFNGVLVPKLFALAADMLGVIHIPTLSWQGVTLNPLQIWMAGNQLLAAATQTTNSNPLDVSGVTWPTDPVFVLASNGLINAALAAGLQPYQNHTFSNSGEFKDLANWNYSGTLKSVTATVKSVGPLTIDAELTTSLTVGASLTAAGMALAAVGCALGAALL